MQYLIYSIEHPELVVISIDSMGEPQLSNNEKDAMLFSDEEAANFIENIIQPSGTEFWGKRPVRK